MRQTKPLLYALLLSLLVHFTLLFSTVIELPEWQPEPSLTVELQAPKPPPPAVLPKPAPRPKPVARPSKPEDPPAPGAAIPEPGPEPTPEPVAAVPQVPQPPPAPEPVPAPPPALATQRAFPERIEISYTVHRGDQGIRLGTTTHKWRIGGQQYLLTSTTEASGLFSLFFSGRYIMTSKGTLTPEGLQPVSFWIQRGQGNDRTESAEFDWASKTLDYGKGVERHHVSIALGAQDQLSAFYQLALTAPHASGLRFALTTGRKFNQYTYQFIGEELLDTALGKLKTRRLARVTTKTDSSESSDIWLAVDYHYLPVRFRLGTRDGEVLDHWIAELRVDDKQIEPKVNAAAQ